VKGRLVSKDAALAWQTAALRIEDRANSLPVNPLWDVLKPGYDLERRFCRPANLSFDNLRR
jgi:hypothetical protein